MSMKNKPSNGETAPGETKSFQAEVGKILDLVVNSLYSNKEIFLRELVSNATDAIDKLRFRALSQPELMQEGSELAIQIDVDEDAGTVTVSDNGIGMTREEAIANLGTIAKSGTKGFMEQLENDFNKRASKLCSLTGNFMVLKKNISVIKIDEISAFPKKGTVPGYQLGINGVVECK